MTTKAKKKFNLANHSSLLSSLVSILCGLIIAFVILMITNSRKGPSAFMCILTGGFKLGGSKNLGTILFYATPIICTGIAMCVAFQAGVFNIGGPGQYSVGGFAAIMTSLYISKDLPAPLTWLLPVLAAIIFGALWAAIPGILKAYFNVNIVISTTMFNYIEMYYMMHWLSLWAYDATKGQSKAVPAVAKLPSAFMPSLTSYKFSDIGIIIAIIFAILAWVLMEKTQLGYELKACGKNSNASRYAGIREKRNIMVSILISGALCGLGGGLMFLSQSGAYLKMTATTAAEGFTGIAVACLANNSPLGAILGGLFLAFLTVGGSFMQVFGFQREIVNVITSIIIYFASFSLFIRQLIERFLNRKKKEINKITGEEIE